MKVNVLVETISLDTQVFVATGFGFNGKSFEALKQYLAHGRLRLVMTEITILEIKARIKQNVTEELVKQRSLINDARALFNSSLPDVQTALKKTIQSSSRKIFVTSSTCFYRRQKRRSSTQTNWLQVMYLASISRVSRRSERRNKKARISGRTCNTGSGRICRG